MSKEKRISGKFRKWCHILHRDLSFFFAGVILIYAFSGIMLNHKRDFNSDYSITQKEYRIAGNFPKAKADFSKAYVLGVYQRRLVADGEHRDGGGLLRIGEKTPYIEQSQSIALQPEPELDDLLGHFCRVAHRHHPHGACHA